MADQLKRCSEHLRKAVAYLSVIPGTPQERLRRMVSKTRFGSVAEDEFPSGPMRYDFAAITGQMGKYSEPQFGKIGAMCDERAQRVIEQIGELSEAVADALGRQNNSA
jgi:hypothetical protein